MEYHTQWSKGLGYRVRGQKVKPWVSAKCLSQEKNKNKNKKHKNMRVTTSMKMCSRKNYMQ